MCIIDDAQQLSLFQVSAVAWDVSFLLMLFDSKQTIEMKPQDNRSTKAYTEFGKFYSWTRCIHGGTHMVPWMCIPITNFVHLPFSKRCGIDVCRLLRETTEHIIENKKDCQTKGIWSGIWSPLEKPSLFTDAELQSLPDTRVRYVFFHSDMFHVCEKPGVLKPATMKIAYKAITGDDKDDSFTPRVAIGKTIFWNMIHEGLMFLSVFLSGNLQMLPEPSCPAFMDVDVYVMSMFYCDDQLIVFSHMVLAALQDLSIRKAYGLPSDANLLHLWRVGKPDDVVGATALLSQTGILPRTVRGANLQGPVRDPGRYEVSYTRASFLTSCFYSWECFQDHSPPTWRKLKRFLSQDSGKLGRAPMMQNVYVEEGQSLATFEIYKQVLFDEKQAFIALKHKFKSPDLTVQHMISSLDFVDKVRMIFPEYEYALKNA